MANLNVVLCPKCHGQMHVNTPPWVAGDQPTFTTNEIRTYRCPVCKGDGYVIPNEDAVISSKGGE